MKHRYAVLLAAAPLLAAVPLTGCAASSTESVAPPAAATTAAPTPAASTPPVEPTPATAVELDVTIAAGKVTPAAANVPVPLGSPVVIKVTSDVADEVHLHGYAIEKEVSAGGTARFDFTADQAGTFELETHESGLLLAKLVVS
ncbi:MAG TPA: hypothetical protein VFN19_05255 [Candidatus Nanopelagicales bacterium]|nr:hypothetical protein [Candidatus Nanopelagicales bacterium]